MCLYEIWLTEHTTLQLVRLRCSRLSNLLLPSFQQCSQLTIRTATAGIDTLSATCTRTARSRLHSRPLELDTDWLAAAHTDTAQPAVVHRAGHSHHVTERTATPPRAVQRARKQREQRD